MTVTPVGLATLMREGSQAEHQEAESSSFMAEMLNGNVNSVGYTTYLAMLQQVYLALENVADQLATDPIASAVIDPALYRREAIAADLAYWAPAGAPEILSPAVDDYVARIQATLGDPVLYLAHHYTRYLGDLSGGQAIGRILARTFELDAPAGVQFYEFTEIPKPKPYKDAYRARLDGLGLSAEDQERVVDEVKAVFDLNGALFAELSLRLDQFTVKAS